MRIGKFVILLGLAFQGFRCVDSHAFNVGFNQAWMKGNFGHQWLDDTFDLTEAKRLLDLAQSAGSKTYRVWLFEGTESNALIWTGGEITGIHPEFLKNFESFLLEAKKRGIQIYPTLFNANALDSVPEGPIRDRWWNLYNQKYGKLEAFKKNALKPLLELLYRSDLRDSVYGIDIANEIDTAIYHYRFENAWFSANQMICSLKNFIHEQAPASRRQQGAKVAFIPVTASIGWPEVPFYSRAPTDVILDPNPHPDCVDFWDIHLYKDDGFIANCERIAAQGQAYQKKIILGEFGQFWLGFSDDMQTEVTRNFIANAERCGFDTALAWSLSDQRAGSASDSRFTYEWNGAMRPAFDVIKQKNLGKRKGSPRQGKK